MSRCVPAAYRALALACFIVPALVHPAAARSHGAKRSQITEIIVHATGGPFCQGGQVKFAPPGNVPSIKKFFEANGTVSIHYIVGRDGEVAASVPEDEVAIHAIGHNEHSVGIEMINYGNGADPYLPEQVAAITKLVGEIRIRYHLPMDAIKRHADVDTSTIPCGGQMVRRKQDPGANFPWDSFKIEVAAYGQEPKLIRPPMALGARR